jgi:hypothetical protein
MHTTNITTHTLDSPNIITINTQRTVCNKYTQQTLQHSHQTTLYIITINTQHTVCNKYTQQTSQHTHQIALYTIIINSSMSYTIIHLLLLLSYES